MHYNINLYSVHLMLGIYLSLSSLSWVKRIGNEVLGDEA